jgi:hypothetical protein
LLFSPDSDVITKMYSHVEVNQLPLALASGYIGIIEIWLEPKYK